MRHKQFRAAIGALAACCWLECSVTGPETIELWLADNLDGKWFHTGDRVTVEWNASTDPSDGFRAFLSIDSGRTQTELPGSPLDGRRRSIVVNVNAELGEFCQIMIVAVDHGVKRSAVSRGFALNRYVILETDLADKRVPPGSELFIKWRTDTARVANGLVVELSIDRGSTWIPQQFEEALDVSQTELRLLLPDAGADSCYLRIHEYDLNERFDSTGPFDIR